MIGGRSTRGRGWTSAPRRTSAVVQHRLAIAALLDEPRLLVGADPGGVERSHAELYAVQAHLAEPVVDDDAHRVRAVAPADVLATEGDPDRPAPVLGVH